MCIAIIGGMDRLETHYRREADKLGFDLKIFNRPTTELSSKIGFVDAVIIFTNKVSHRARIEAIQAAKARNIAVYHYHSCGICTLRSCFDCINNVKN